MSCKVAIRVDGAAWIGSGHIQRCLSLADALRAAGAEVRFAMRDLGGAFADQVAARGFESVMLAAPESSLDGQGGGASRDWAVVPQARDAADTIGQLVAWAPDWVVVDHYGLQREWHLQVSLELDCRLAVIDDLADRPLAGALLVDHNLHPDHRAKYAASLSSIGRMLVGPRYALLSQAYRTAAIHIPAPEVRSVGIFLGGVDRDGYSALAIAACRAAGFAGPIEVVSTSANPDVASLRAAVAADGNAQLVLDLPDLADFFARHDLQIGAGGGASWERCRVGAPAIVLKCADNQSVVTAGLRAEDAAVTVERPGIDEIGDAVRLLVADHDRRVQIAANAARLVDGRGAERVALAIVRDVRLRPASYADALPTLSWRNDPATRAYIRDRRLLNEADHLAWWSRTLVAIDRALLVGQVGGIDVGVLRLDFAADASAEVSIYLDPALAGLGLGVPLLRACQRWIRENHPGIDRLTAEIHAENAGSRRAFATAGFLENASRWEWTVA